MALSINAAFDGGNIRVISLDGNAIELEVARDHQSNFYQWFYFRLAGARGRTLRLRILNAAGSAFPSGWPGYNVRASTDRLAWRTIPTRYAEGVLEFDWMGDSDFVWFAYFAPYPMERHDALVARIAACPGVGHRELGISLEGQAIDCLVLGQGPKPVWLYGRQHPGEPMTEWWMEGALEWLTSSPASPLLAKAKLYVVPNMNPDGTRRGHLRTNAAGVNLNREWQEPTRERSPEVLCVRDAMDATGVAFAIDVHGDEAIPANFLVGFDGIPAYDEARGALFRDYANRLAAQTPDFQTERGYGKVPAGKANLTISTNQVAQRYGAVAMTLEMPFKDCETNPDAEFGWSPERCKALGHACLEVLAGIIDDV